MSNGGTRRRRRGRHSKDPSSKATKQPSGNARARSNSNQDNSKMGKGGSEPSMTWIMVCAGIYVLSGVTQPILMAYAQHAGLADPRCQLYMLFYYIGPALVGVTMRRRRRRRSVGGEDATINATTTNGESLLDNQCGDVTNNGASSYGATSQNNNNGSTADGGHEEYYCETLEDDDERTWPSLPLLRTASFIALFDIFAQSMVYTGNNLAGPTIFAIIYSSVTIWTAIYSKFLLNRSLSRMQWVGVGLVVMGLCLTAMDSLKVGRSVFGGAVLIGVGSSFHGLTYVLSEKIMTPDQPSPTMSQILSVDATAVLPTKNDSNGTNGSNGNNGNVGSARREPRHISVRANCAIQGGVATAALLLWQLVYTLPRLQPLILDPMTAAGTTYFEALMILCTITLANLLHAVTFFATLKHFPGGATSAGVLKGLQAVLVFGASAVMLCGRWGGAEMCWSRTKFASLVVVVGGIVLYGSFTEKTKGDGRGMSSSREKEEYDALRDASGLDGKIMCV